MGPLFNSVACERLSVSGDSSRFSCCLTHLLIYLVLVPAIILLSRLSSLQGDMLKLPETKSSSFPVFLPSPPLIPAGNILSLFSTHFRIKDQRLSMFALFLNR